MSPELRAPLAAITGSAFTLLDPPEALDPAEMREFFRIILEPAGLVERARSTLLAGDTGCAVAVDLEDGLPPAMADRRRVVQVLNNLLAKAARHTEASATIRVAARSDGRQVPVSVSDDGAGLAPELLPHLFRKRAGAGHGLGLAVCKGLVEAHGGHIRAESEGAGRGTTITFALPAAEPGDAAAGPAAPRRKGSGTGERPHVLVVDDDPHALRFARDALSKAGYAPVTIGAPVDLAGLIRAERPALVLLDLMLPGRDGLQLFQETPKLSDLPVIFVSA